MVLEPVITSRQNPRVKYIKSLGLAKFRQQEGKYLIEGILFVEEALEAGAPIRALVLSPKIKETPRGRALLERARQGGLSLTWVSQEILAYLAATESPQGVLAVLETVEPPPLPDVFEEKDFFLLVDGVQDPGNLGTIIRTADAAGLSGVVLSRGTVDLYNPKVLRGTMGSVFHLPVWQDVDGAQFLEQRKNKVQIVAAHLEGKVAYEDIDLTIPTVLVVGSEAHGPDPTLLAKADALVKIPMPGRAESLNVAVACGILLFEGVRQRLKKGILTL